MILGRINIRGIIILVALFAAIQFGFAFVISPVFKNAMVDVINKANGSKVTIETIRVWPLTLSVSAKGVKVYDPSGEEKMVEIKKADARISVFALLSKRLVISNVGVSGADIFLRTEKDGSFNLEKLAQAKQQGAGASIIDHIKGGFQPKKDWIGKIYEAVKKRSTKAGAEEARNNKSVKREVIELPRGKKVEFKTLSDEYVFVMRELKIDGANIHLVADDENVDIVDARMALKDVMIDPKRGAAFSGLSAKGILKKGGQGAGEFKLSYAQNYRGDAASTGIDISAKGVDMAAVRFLYKDSLPVNVEKGKIDIVSKTVIMNGAIDSRNSIHLTGQTFSAKSGQQGAVGFIPMPILVDALNKIDPINLKFDIIGTTDKPEFSGFLKSLQELVKPYVTNLGQETAKSIGSMIKEKLSGQPSGTYSSRDSGSPASQKAVDSIKALFKKQQ